LSSLREHIKNFTPHKIRRIYGKLSGSLNTFLQEIHKAILFLSATSNSNFLKKITNSLYKHRKIVYLIGIDELEKKYSKKIVRSNTFETQMMFSYVKVFENPIDFFEDATLIQSKTSVFLLSDVKVFGASNLVLLDENRALYDLKNIQNNNIIISDEIFFGSKNSIYLYHFLDSDLNIDEAVSVLINYSHNYYHFLYEALSKFQFFNHVDSNIPLLVDEIVDRTPQFRELLVVFNQDKRKIIFIKRRQKVSVKKLHHVGLINVIPPNFKDNLKIKCSDVLFESSNLSFIRNKVIYNLPKCNHAKKIFISRKGASSRRKYNEEEICVFLKERGFDIIVPQEYSIFEQIAIFNNADIIIGGSGAAFTNLIFCNQNAKIFILMKNTFNLSIFSTLAKFVGCDLQFIEEAKNAETFQSKDLHDEFRIDTHQILRAIS
jgi:hypothetical protein